MNYRRLGARVISAAVVLGAFGCGAGSIGLDEAGSSGEAGETGDGDGDAGDGDGDVPADACIEDGQLQRALAIVDANAQQVRVLEPGGAERVLPASLPEGVDALASVQVVTSPGFIAVTSSYTIYVEPGVTEEGSVLRLFDRPTGTLLWEREFDGRRLGQVFVDGQGRVVATMGWSAAAQPPAGVVVIDGELTQLPNFAPSGPLGENDWMAGWVVDESGEYLGPGLVQPFADELIEVSDAWGTTWQAVEQTIEYIDADGDVPELVLARANQSVRIELSPFAGLDGTIHVVGSAGDYRLLALTPGDDGPPSLLRVQVSSEAVLAIDVMPPDLLEPFDCYFPRTTVDEAGRILFELRDAGAAQMHAWNPDTSAWTALGVPMTAVDDIDLGGRFGHVELIQGHGANTTYCLPTEWSEPPASAVAGSSIQLARIDPPLSVVIDAEPFTAVSVDGSERCATWTDASGVVVHDLDDGDELTLDVNAMAIWLD